MSEQAPTIIPLPTEAPAQLCLYAIVAREQESTSIYLCNSGGNTLHAVVMRIDMISMQRYYTGSGKALERGKAYLE